MTNLADVQVPLPAAAAIVSFGLAVSWRIFAQAQALARSTKDESVAAAKDHVKAAMHLHENAHHGAKHETA